MDKTKDFKRLQAVELEILKIVTDILEKNNLKSFLIEGTCLGAIRHEGFIPWDDDIDIGLIRKDYEIARKVLIENLPKGYLYIDNRTNSEYPYNFGKVKKSGTTFVSAGDEHLNINHGIKIDIFPLDDGADTIKKTKKEMRVIKWYRLASDISFMDYKKDGKYRKFYQRCLIFLGHVLLNHVTIQNKIDKFCMRHLGEHNKWVCSYLSRYIGREIFDKEIFGEGVFVKFEDAMFRVPEKYDKYLTIVYGDYMKLPPVEKRVFPHEVICLDFENELIKSH